MGIRIKLVVLLSAAVLAQTAVTHAQGTVWEFLGIPQGIRRLNDQIVNRRGNRPKLEKKPPLKKIADPANLESKWEAIKVAAEVKQAEDAAPQKIKAVKYLASIGCACYDKKMDGAVTEALVAAMDDCTESVRLATIKAIAEVACDEKCACDKCGSKSCCSEAIMMQLAKLAYERDETGCYVEPSEDVREAAIEALQCCCPGEDEIILEGEAPYVPERERERGDSEDFEVPDPPSVTDSEFPSQDIPVVDSFSASAARPPVQSFPITSQLPPVMAPIEGHVERVDVQRDQVYLTLADGATLALGSDVEVSHHYLLGPRTVATLKVEASFPGTAIARPMHPGLTRRIAAGDAFTGWSSNQLPAAAPELAPTEPVGSQVAGSPVHPEAGRSALVRPEGVSTEVARPKVVRPEVVGPEVVGPEVVRPEVVRPEVVRREATRPEVVRPEVVRPEVVRPEVVRREITRPEVVRPEVKRPEVVRSEIAARPQATRPEVAPPEVTRPEVAPPTVVAKKLPAPRKPEPPVVEVKKPQPKKPIEIVKVRRLPQRMPIHNVEQLPPPPGRSSNQTAKVEAGPPVIKRTPIRRRSVDARRSAAMDFVKAVTESAAKQEAAAKESPAVPPRRHSAATSNPPRTPARTATVKPRSIVVRPTKKRTASRTQESDFVNAVLK